MLRLQLGENCVRHGELRRRPLLRECEALTGVLRIETRQIRLADLPLIDGAGVERDANLGSRLRFALGWGGACTGHALPLSRSSDLERACAENRIVGVIEQVFSIVRPGNVKDNAERVPERGA